MAEHIFQEKKASDWSIGSLYVVFLRMVAAILKRLYSVPRTDYRTFRPPRQAYSVPRAECCIMAA